MSSSSSTTQTPGGQLRKWMSGEVILTALSVVFIASVHASTAHSRLLMNGYYVILWGAAYVLLQRRALTLMVFLLTTAFGTEMAHTHFGRVTNHAQVPIDSMVGFATWSILVLLFGLLAREAYKINQEMRRAEVQRAIEEKVISARTAALTCMAHELRTPIASVVACVETLELTMADKIDGVEKRFLQLVHESSQHLMALVNKLLDYGKAQTGGIAFSPGLFSPQKVVEAAVAMIGPQAAKQELTVSIHVDSCVDDIVADEFHFKQILLNLLSNAVKHSPPGEQVRIHVEQSGNDLLVKISDAGAGLSEEQIDHIFDPYYQAAQSSFSPGTGLGLGIVKLLVNLQGGSVSVESNPGAGSTFTVRFPRHAVQNQMRQADTDETWEAVLAQSRAAVNPNTDHDDDAQTSADADALCV